MLFRICTSQFEKGHHHVYIMKGRIHKLTIFRYFLLLWNVFSCFDVWNNLQIFKEMVVPGKYLHLILMKKTLEYYIRRNLVFHTYIFIHHIYIHIDCLCGLVVRVPGYRFRGPGINFRRFQIFWEAAGLDRSPLSLVRTTEELLERKSSGSGKKKTEINDRGYPLGWPRDTLYPQKLALLRQQAAMAQSV
jgi:hypothetical protein